MAPEVLDGSNYDQSCDMWSIGVIAFFMLAGFPPFNGRNDREVVNKITTCNYSFDDEVWKTISQEGIDWIDHLLESDPAARMTAD